MTGMIFDIQRFSLHDGPGIRTTVFMKGCPLRCRWCHNPEGLSVKPQLQFLEELCIGCGRCGNREALADAENCPAGALRICGRNVDEDQVIEEILKDRMFYGDNGGVTFSGGECLMQADFVAAVLTRAKALGLHTAVDTSGCVPWSAIEKTLPCCDLYLYDIKCMDGDCHKHYTGVDNTLILENLKRLSRCGKEIWIRIPVIPDFNNRETEMTAIADFVSALPSVTQVTLMPYHTLGASKYPTLGLIYPFDTCKRITEEEQERFRPLFTSRRITVS